MNIESLRERLSEIDKQYEENRQKIIYFNNEIKKLEIEQQRLTGANAEVTRLIQELNRDNGGENDGIQGVN